MRIIINQKSQYSKTHSRIRKEQIFDDTFLAVMHVMKAFVYDLRKFGKGFTITFEVRKEDNNGV